MVAGVPTAEPVAGTSFGPGSWGPLGATARSALRLGGALGQLAPGLLRSGPDFGAFLIAHVLAETSRVRGLSNKNLRKLPEIPTILPESPECREQKTPRSFGPRQLPEDEPQRPFVRFWLPERPQVVVDLVRDPTRERVHQLHAPRRRVLLRVALVPQLEQPVGPRPLPVELARPMGLLPMETRPKELSDAPREPVAQSLEGHGDPTLVSVERREWQLPLKPLRKEPVNTEESVIYEPVEYRVGQSKPTIYGSQKKPLGPLLARLEPLALRLEEFENAEEAQQPLFDMKQVWL